MQRFGPEPHRFDVDPQFDALVRAELPDLLRYATALCRDPEQGRDLVQDVLVRAYERWPRIRATDRPAAYLIRMVTNEFLSWRRRWSTRTVVLTVDGDLADRPSADHADAVADQTDLAARLARLPRRQRAALVLRYYAGLEHAEIATALDCSIGTARSLCSRGLATLRISDTDHQPLTPTLERP